MDRPETEPFEPAFTFVEPVPKTVPKTINVGDCFMGKSFMFPQTRHEQTKFYFSLVLTLMFAGATAATSWGLYHEVEEKENVNAYGLLVLIFLFFFLSIFSGFVAIQKLYPCYDGGNA